MHRLVLALSVIAIMSIGAGLGGRPVSAARAALPQPIYFWGDVSSVISGPGRSPQPEVTRPSRIFLHPDGSWDIEQLHWTGWGSSVAHATGISSASNGIPNMAQGKRIKKPAQVTLSSPGPFNGHEVYRCFTLTIPTLAVADQHLCLKVLGGGVLFLPPATTKPTATTPAISPPVQAVRALSLNFTTCKRNGWGPGGSVVDRTSFGPSCPVTPRLRSWLQTHPSGSSAGEYGAIPPNVMCGCDVICRCQQSPPPTFRVSANNGGAASVMQVTYGNVTFVVLHMKGGWLVDDTYCTHGNRSTTSIYHRPLAACPV